MQRRRNCEKQLGCNSGSPSLHHCSEPESRCISVFPTTYHHVVWSAFQQRTPFPTLSLIGTEALMEILGLVPCQSQTQYLDAKLRAIDERQQSINKLPLCDGSVAALFPLSRNFTIAAATKRKHVAALFPLLLPPCFRFYLTINSNNQENYMATKPYQSKLIPYEEEIMELRRRRPPVAYAQIAELLCTKYRINVRRETIFKFIRVRSRGRKVFSYGRNIAAEEPRLNAVIPQPAKPASDSPPKPRFEYKYSQRYNLHRLPPEEAAARLKKLEEEGH